MTRIIDGGAGAPADLALEEDAGAAARPPVLVVDDEETIRELLARVVHRAGGRAELADSLAAARARLEGRTYDCAIVDKNLPDGSGLELVAELHAEAPETHVLVVTGYGNMESAIEALRLGAFDYVVKPFDVTAVAHRVGAALERRRLRRELEATTAALRRAHASLAESRQEVQRAYLETVLSLSRAVEHRDARARAHVARISRAAAVVARAIGATPEWVERIVIAAPLHDIGMIGVPEVVLRKRGPLTSAERVAVNEHVLIGARILEGTHSDVLALARDVVLTHHERWDGGGYPRGLRGEEIPLAGRIVALCDAWDAVSTDRPYRRALPDEAAVAEIERGAGTAFDPALVDAFRDVLPQLRAIRDDGGEGTPPADGG